MTACRRGGADAVIVGAGTLERCAQHLRGLGVILAIGPLHGGAQKAVDHALRLGADAVKAEVFPFGDRHQEAIDQLEDRGIACAARSLPLLAEVVPGSFDAVAIHTSANIATGARIAAEMGADIVKVPWPNKGTLEDVVSYATIPVVILGGPASSRTAMSGRAASVVKAGAAGVAVGRNVFEDSDPAAAIAEALVMRSTGTTLRRQKLLTVKVEQSAEVAIKHHGSQCVARRIASFSSTKYNIKWQYEQEILSVIVHEFASSVSAYAARAQFCGI